MATQWSLRDGGWGDTVKWFSGDFNGDGRTDIGAAWNNNGVTTLTVRQSTGSNFSPVHWSLNAGNWADASAFVAGDFNGDGRTDVARLWNDQGSNSTSVSLSNGTSFPAPAAWSVRDGGWISGDAVKWFPGDFNGDGRSDIGAAIDREWVCPRPLGDQGRWLAEQRDVVQRSVQVDRCRDRSPC